MEAEAGVMVAVEMVEEVEEMAEVMVAGGMVEEAEGETAADS